MGRKKDLFKDLDIDRLTKDKPDAWHAYPVFYFDFDGKNYKKDNALEELLELNLRRWEKQYGQEYSDMAQEERFGMLLQLAHEKTGLRSVVLVDEYDKPLLEVLDHPKRLDHNKAVLKGLFGNLKKHDEDIHFIFITGVTKFHKESIFSDLNNLNDISLDESYATICGITESELKDSCSKEIDALASKQHLSTI